MMYSDKWKTWTAKLDFKTCFTCRGNHGKIYKINENVHPKPPIHPHCRCVIEKLKAIFAGAATNQGLNGADWYLKEYGILPEYYITKDYAEKIGYKSYLGNLFLVAPGKMLFKGKYKNLNGHLPEKSGRVWYEADINYEWGYRGTERIVFSNDGLIFVTYDHFYTFYEIK
ncbi:MAG: phage head morphogenesis protein [Clostridia bacterium]|nr:phage head morphogenesis protein [Clostridia bacterium]